MRRWHSSFAAAYDLVLLAAARHRHAQLHTGDRASA
eukprot:CAMPEP_0178453334 /NCGR_PEP_ID=MMETSP0689_2-20121128/44753_1 /TAXON_ID=160604 /ORGANISM="Amphidinium massartii, Strain CS-259" /LENGTH=35 /DNA_ID= /DNA_START= /DNA_END= /DNA_ORIENTATION=